MPKIEELLVILLIIMLLFGAKKIPELAKSMGQAAREVRKGFSGEDDDSSRPSKKSSSK